MNKLEIFDKILKLPVGKTKYKVKFADKSIGIGTIYNFSENNDPYFEIDVSDFGRIYSNQYNESLVYEEDPRLNIVGVIDTEDINISTHTITVIANLHNKITIMCRTKTELNNLIALLHINKMPFLCASKSELNKQDMIDMFNKSEKYNILVGTVNELEVGYNISNTDWIIVIDNENKLTEADIQQIILRGARVGRKTVLYFRKYVLGEWFDKIILPLE